MLENLATEYIGPHWAAFCPVMTITLLFALSAFVFWTLFVRSLK